MISGCSSRAYWVSMLLWDWANWFFRSKNDDHSTTSVCRDCEFHWLDPIRQDCFFAAFPILALYLFLDFYGAWAFYPVTVVKSGNGIRFWCFQRVLGIQPLNVDSLRSSCGRRVKTGGKLAAETIGERPATLCHQGVLFQAWHTSCPIAPLVRPWAMWVAPEWLSRLSGDVTGMRSAWCSATAFVPWSWPEAQQKALTILEANTFLEVWWRIRFVTQLDHLWTILV